MEKGLISTDQSKLDNVMRGDHDQVNLVGTVTDRGVSRSIIAEEAK